MNKKDIKISLKRALNEYMSGIGTDSTITEKQKPSPPKSSPVLWESKQLLACSSKPPSAKSLPTMPREMASMMGFEMAFGRWPEECRWAVWTALGGGWLRTAGGSHGPSGRGRATEALEADGETRAHGRADGSPCGGGSATSCRVGVGSTRTTTELPVTLPRNLGVGLTLTLLAII